MIFLGGDSVSDFGSPPRFFEKIKKGCNSPSFVRNLRRRTPVSATDCTEHLRFVSIPGISWRKVSVVAYISVTTALGQAGTQLLNKLIELAQERGEETDDAVFTIIEHWAREVIHVTNMPAIFNAAQDEFAAASGASACWLEAFSALFEHGGEAIPAFADNLWRTYFFRLEDAPDALWSQYPDLQRAVTLNTDPTLPRSWGEGVLIEDSMSIAEAHLNASIESFEYLVISQDTVELLTDLASTEAPSPQKPEMPDGPALPPDAATTLVAYLTACTTVIGQIDPRGLLQVGRVSILLENVFMPLRLAPFAAYAKPVRAVRYQTATFVSADLFAFKEPLKPGELETHPGLMPQDVLSHHPQVLILGEADAGLQNELLMALSWSVARAKPTPPCLVSRLEDTSCRN
jgi:hypothetical protein